MLPGRGRRINKRTYGSNNELTGINSRIEDLSHILQAGWSAVPAWA